MAVSTVNRTDPNGQYFDSAITTLTAQLAVLNSSVSALTYKHVKGALDSLQKEAVVYYMSIGRISAATILSTLS
jgi:hypothetical protein